MTTAHDALPTAILRLGLYGPAALKEQDMRDPLVAQQVRAILQGGGPAYGALWREHEPTLRAYAAANNLRPVGGARWFAQAVARRLLAAPVRVAARATVPRSAASPRRAVAREYRVPAVYPDDVRISVHEAAHAVVAVKCGWGIRSVRIGLNPPAFTSRGRTSMSNSDRPNATTFGLVVASLAGSEAERHAFGNVGPGNDAGDIEAAREDLADLFTLRLDDPAIESRWLPFAREQAAECVARHWDAISRVAAALRRHRTLDGQQVAVLIDTDAERTT